MRDEGTGPDFARGSDLLRRAYALAEEAHRGQTRKDGASPYIGHPLAVTERLAEAGMQEATLAAALLHDVVEDTDMSIGEVVEDFGVEVGELVAALTDDRSIDDYVGRKRKHRERVAEAGPKAAAIYAADKLVNVRDMRRLYAEMGEAASVRFNAPIDVRLDLWRDDLGMVERLGAPAEIARELRAELEAFERERDTRRRHADVA